jgi:hypothetical protein
VAQSAKYLITTSRAKFLRQQLADSVEKLDVGMSFWAPAMFDAGDPGRYFVVLDRGCCPTRH